MNATLTTRDESTSGSRASFRTGNATKYQGWVAKSAKGPTTLEVVDPGSFHPEAPIPRLRTLLWRGMRRRCPHCGRGPVFKGWIKMHDRCSICALQYFPDQGDLWAYLIVIDRALFIFPLIVMIYFRLYVPDVRWFYVLAALLSALFVGTMPHRNGMSLGVDYLIRRKWGDLSEAEAKHDSVAPPRNPPPA